MQIYLDKIILEINSKHISKGGSNRKAVYKFAIEDQTSVPFIIGMVGLYYGETVDQVYDNHFLFSKEIITDLNRSEQIEPKNIEMMIPKWVEAKKGS